MLTREQELGMVCDLWSGIDSTLRGREWREIDRMLRAIGSGETLSGLIELMAMWERTLPEWTDVYPAIQRRVEMIAAAHPEEHLCWESWTRAAKTSVPMGVPHHPVTMRHKMTLALAWLWGDPVPDDAAAYFTDSNVFSNYRPPPDTHADRECPDDLIDMSE